MFASKIGKILLKNLDFFYCWLNSDSNCLRPKPEEGLEQLDSDLLEGQQWMWAMQLKKSLAADFLPDNIVWQICYVTPCLNLNLTLLHFSTKEPVFNDNGCSHNEERKCAIYHGKGAFNILRAGVDCSDQLIPQLNNLQCNFSQFLIEGFSWS